MKKTLALVLTVLLVIGLFAGCTGNNGGNTTAASSTTTAATTTKAAATTAATTTTPAAPKGPVFNETGYPIYSEPVTYSMMNSVTTQNVTGKWDDLAYITAMNELTNITFEFSNTIQTDYDTKMNLSLASGTMYDIYVSVGADNIRTYGVEAGKFLQMEDYFAKYMPNLTIRDAENNGNLLKAVTQSDGHIYDFPRNVETATIAVATLYARTDITTPAGYDEERINSLKTIDEVYELMKAVQEQNKDNAEFVTLLPYGVGHLDAVNENYFFPAFGDDAYSGFYVGDDGKVRYNVDSDQMFRYLEFMNKLYQEKILYNEVYTADTATVTAITKANNAAFLTYGTMLTMDNFTSGNYDQIILPLVTSEYTDTIKCKGYNAISASTRVVSSTAENPEGIFRWFDVSFSDEEVAPGLNAISDFLGIRGKTWDYVGDNNEFYTIYIPNGVTLSATEVNYSYNGPQMHGYLNIMAIQQGASPGLTCKGVESLKKLYPYHVKPFPNLMYTSDESDKITSINTEIGEYVKSMKAKFISGAEPLSNWPTFVSTLEKMGVKDLVDVTQVAYDRYIK